MFFLMVIIWVVVNVFGELTGKGGFSDWVYISKKQY